MFKKWFLSEKTISQFNLNLKTSSLRKSDVKYTLVSSL